MEEKKQKTSLAMLKAYNRATNGKRKVFCMAPFTSMRIAIDGGIYACNHNSIDRLGKYPEQSLMQTWQGKERKSLQKRISSHAFGDGCAFCVDDIVNERYAQGSFGLFDDLPVHKMPSMIDFRLSNHCNLKCIMCSGLSSSQFGTGKHDENELFGDEFLEQLDPFLPALQTARFIGGEPLAIPVYYKIWERMISVNPNCNIVVQTNATILNDHVKILARQGKFHFSASIDSMDETRYRAIRINADFTKVLTNIAWFAQYAEDKQRDFVLCFCPMRVNYREIPDFIEWANSMKAHVCLNRFMYPAHLALWSLPAGELKNIYQELSRTELRDDTLREKQNKDFFRDFLSLIHDWAEVADHRTLREPNEKDLQNILDYLIDHMPADEELKKRMANLAIYPERRKLYQYLKPVVKNYAPDVFFEAIRHMSPIDLYSDIDSL